MATVLLILVYVIFFCVGLPNSLVQSAWPAIRPDISAQLAAVGVLSFIQCSSNILGSLLSDRLVRKAGTGAALASCLLVIAISVAGYALAPSFLWFILLSIPLGMAIGAADAGVNNYVALHYQPRHMNWLHCCWSFGSSAGALLLAQFLAGGAGWRTGFASIGGGILLVVATLFCTLSLWKRQPALQNAPTKHASAEPLPALKGTAGLLPAMVTCFFFCGLELTPNVWGSSFLAEVKGMDAADAARWVSYYFGGITAGRIIAGFATMKFSSMQLIRAGQGMAMLGVVLMLLPVPAYWVALLGFVLIGLGTAPIYPCLLQATPGRFGAEKSQRVISLQVAAAFAGSALLPPVFGVAVSAGVPLAWLPWFLLVCGVVHILGSERVFRSTGGRQLQ